MRDRIGRYLTALTLALGTAPVLGQRAGAADFTALAPNLGAQQSASQQHLVCGNTAELAARIQGESRPRLPDSYQTEHFVIYYTTAAGSPHAPALDDANKNGIPDYIESLGLAFEQAWSFYSTPSPQGLGYNLPPMHPGSRYPVVVYSLPDGYSGMTWPDSKAGRRATSHISIDAHLYDPYFRQVAAHEFFHAVQFGYNYTASLWWREASADWAAHQVFPDVDTYMIPYSDWFQVPGWSLDYTDHWHEYGDSIWVEQLSETRGRDLIHAIWLGQRDVDDSNTAIDQTLASAGTSLAAQFTDFAAWNWFTGSRDDGAHYKDGHLYPMLAPDDHPAGSMPSFGDSVQPLGSAYLALVPPPSSAAAAQPASGNAPGSSPARTSDTTAAPLARGLTVRLKIQAGLEAQLILERTDGTRSTAPFPGSRFHIAGFEQSYRRAVVVLSNGDPQARHAFDGTIALGVVYRDQYGYLWDLELSPTGAVLGTVDVGDQQPWPVQGQITGSSFHWRAVNPSPNTGWTTGFDVTGSLPDQPAAASRWTNDAGRSDSWIGSLIDGSVPAPGPFNSPGPAHP